MVSEPKKTITFKCKTAGAGKRKRQILKAARIIVVSRMLQTSDEITCEQTEDIANKIGVCQRTIERDITVIREANRIIDELDLIKEVRL